MFLKRTEDFHEFGLSFLVRFEVLDDVTGVLKARLQLAVAHSALVHVCVLQTALFLYV